jgi:hypothetical protein
MCSEEPIGMQENKDMLSNFIMIARYAGDRSALLRYIVELVEIICTGLKSVIWTDRAAESRFVQWKALSVHWKGSNVQRKAAPGAAES